MLANLPLQNDTHDSTVMLSLLSVDRMMSAWVSPESSKQPTSTNGLNGSRHDGSSKCQAAAFPARAAAARVAASFLLVMMGGREEEAEVNGMGWRW